MTKDIDRATEHSIKWLDIKEFGTAIWSDWRALVSGIFSVPFTVAAIYLDSTYSKAVFTALAVLAFLFSIFRIWRNERDLKKTQISKVMALEDRLKPKFILSFDPKNRICVTPVPNSQDQTATAFRLKVESDSPERVLGCCGKLLSISGPFGKRSQHQFLQLTFTPSSSADTTSKVLDYQAPIYLDIVNVFEGNIVSIPTNEPLPNGEQWDNFFSDRGEYIFEVLVSANVGTPESCKLKFLWQGNWRTAQMEMIL